ncbi:hypothetical protein BUALT_Bualt07G0126000 [Buddleja alternifolia]|uniref:PGG domain-containing protein n=1 Tax=Buddleja alternifolia TaxID=168488 RepID=A0AAV6XEP5_9LAMI|nr:hypothetical protein BUALT_Bualt07G0126000 [Buddleja alternifolia]
MCAINADLAFDLVNKYPHLATLCYMGESALKTMAGKSSAFRSGHSFSFWERCIYNGKSMRYGKSSNYLELLPVQHDLSVPKMKSIYHMKLKHLDAIRLVECLLKKMESLTELETFTILYDARFCLWSRHQEMNVEKTYFCKYRDNSGNSLLHSCATLAPPHKLNLVSGAALQMQRELQWFKMNVEKTYFASIWDNSGNSLLHSCATLAPPHKLNLVSGAALQMQRELQWFKEIENFVVPYVRESKNYAGETPPQIFTEEHKELKKEGEKWMRNTANSCILVAALIVTVVFAAAITVPGGNDQSNGIPIWSKQIAFIIFAMSQSDAISLFTSTTSLLLFLSLLTSRYAEEDFLFVLPKRLSIGLLILFLSITFMVVAFSATVYLVFGQRRAWVLIPVSALACFPITRGRPSVT